MDSDPDYGIRALVAKAAAHAADKARQISGEDFDAVALADQFEAAGLDSLAKHGFDVRTHLPDDPS